MPEFPALMSQNEAVVVKLLSGVFRPLAPLLAMDAALRPRSGPQTRRRDLLFTLHAKSIGSIVNAIRCQTKLTCKSRTAIRDLRCNVAFRSILGHVDRVGDLVHADQVS